MSMGRGHYSDIVSGIKGKMRAANVAVTSENAAFFKDFENIENVPATRQAQLILEMLKNKYLSHHDIDKLAQLKSAKESVWEAIKALPAQEKIEAIYQAITPWSMLGAFYWAPRGNDLPSLQKGMLKKIFAEFQQHFNDGQSRDTVSAKVKGVLAFSEVPHFDEGVETAYNTITDANIVNVNFFNELVEKNRAQPQKILNLLLLNHYNANAIYSAHRLLGRDDGYKIYELIAGYFKALTFLLEQNTNPDVDQIIYYLADKMVAAFREQWMLPSSAPYDDYSSPAKSAYANFLTLSRKLAERKLIMPYTRESLAEVCVDELLSSKQGFKDKAFNRTKLTLGTNGFFFSSLSPTDACCVFNLLVTGRLDPQKYFLKEKETIRQYLLSIENPCERWAMLSMAINPKTKLGEYFKNSIDNKPEPILAKLQKDIQDLTSSSLLDVYAKTSYLAVPEGVVIKHKVHSDKHKAEIKISPASLYPQLNESASALDKPSSSTLKNDISDVFKNRDAAISLPVVKKAENGRSFESEEKIKPSPIEQASDATFEPVRFDNTAQIAALNKSVAEYNKMRQKYFLNGMNENAAPCSYGEARAYFDKKKVAVKKPVPMVSVSNTVLTATQAPSVSDAPHATLFGRDRVGAPEGAAKPVSAAIEAKPVSESNLVLG